MATDNKYGKMAPSMTDNGNINERWYQHRMHGSRPRISPMNKAPSVADNETSHASRSFVSTVAFSDIDSLGRELGLRS